MRCNFSKINCLKPVTAVFSAAALLFSFCGCEDYLEEIEHDAPERVLINTKHIYQTDNWPTGCESVTAVMALNAAGIEISVDDFIDDYLVCTEPLKGDAWEFKGKKITWIRPEHCLLLIGYDSDNYIFCDPMRQEDKTAYPKSSVERAYEALHSQAVVIERK